VRGAGLTGSAEIEGSRWIDVRPVKNAADLTVAQQKLGLGIGELSTIILGKETNASLVLIDEAKARIVAREQGLSVLGCVGVLEDAFGLQLLSDLPEAYRQLLASGAYVDPKILQNSLRQLNLPSL
jgi:predicted nucleic acid-binding protein